MVDVFSDSFVAAIGAMGDAGPRPLLARANFEAADRGGDVDISLAALRGHLEAASLNDLLRKRLHVAISGWDVATATAWTAGTAPRSRGRRDEIYKCLGLESDRDTTQVLDGLFPWQAESAVVISDEFQPWYDAARQRDGAFYWPAYRSLLERRGWNGDALAGLDQATSQVIERLTDPYRPEARQAKGLVVGYVQSGKTANFTGVAAKAIDAGYRLIIVLTGTIDVLRRQTQRRLDMELVGKENILRGVNAANPQLLAQVDYQDDRDWETKFQSFGFLPSTKNFPDIMRLTSARFDFKNLKAGIAALEFERADKSKPLFAKENLPTSSARIVVVKKNKTVLNKLVNDLKSTITPQHEIPTLIIDDESDQASPNTSDPAKWVEGQPTRTAINKAISDLLRLLPRAQYVGYTATPFANVFIDPSDIDDIFPKDFLISLPRPVGYMGVSDFHDLDGEVEPDEQTFENSNERAFVRAAVNAGGDAGEPKLQECMDAFVLSGAIKQYRSAVDGEAFRHHTMLVHASVQQREHGVLAEEIRRIWRGAAYTGPAGLARLRALFANDFLPVSTARAGRYSIPPDFDTLRPHIASTVAKILALGDPVIVVNGDREMASEEVDFDRREVWRILVGGTKLSRGFTVEGLTISYYRRKTKQADTLMQMGRWFGFRPGYQDLVRLYIGRAEPDGIDRTVDLYEAFEAIVQDEEAFRSQLRKYSQLVDGRPQLTPKEIPPLVSQHLPWLKPAARNKMFNAELVVRRTAGSLVIPTGYANDADARKKNYRSVVPIFAAASREVELVVPPDVAPARTKFSAWIGEIGTSDFLSAVHAIKWITSDYYQADKAYLDEIADKIEKWIIIAPQTADEKNKRDLPGVGLRTVFSRDLKPPHRKLWGEPTDRKHRPAVQFVTGNYPNDYGDPVLQPLKNPNVGAALIYPMAPQPSELPKPPQPDQIVLAVAWITPWSIKTGTTEVVQFRAKNSALAKEPIVPASA